GVYELLKNRALNLRPVGFIDDDVNKRGKIVAGLPVLGNAREIEHVLRATAASGVLISSDKITPRHVERAALACHSTHGRLFHLDIGVHRMDEEESPMPIAPARSFVGARPVWVVSFSGEGASYLPQRCPSCNCVHIHRSKARNVFERVKKLRTDKRLYRCEECGWRGWVIPLDLWVRIGALFFFSFLFRGP